MDDADEGEVFSLDVDVDEGRTVVTVTGTRDAALVVYSASGEEVYLPPEDFDAVEESTGEMASPYESSYAGSPPADSPYEAADGGRRGETSDAEGRRGGETPIGLESTADGFRVLHPEPVTDLRLLR